MLRGVGAVMFLTSARILVARDGYERRPRSGIQSFALGQISAVQLERGGRSSGRIVVLAGDASEVVSMFFDATSLERAAHLVALANARIVAERPGLSRRRRRGLGRV